MADRKWLTEEKLPDGHRIFGRPGPDGYEYAIADDSGELPEDTDDGVLYLDVTRCLSMSTKWAPTIPLRDEEGERRSTISDGPTVMYLAATLGWIVADEVRNRFYTVTQNDDKE